MSHSGKKHAASKPVEALERESRAVTPPDVAFYVRGDPIVVPPRTFHGSRPYAAWSRMTSHSPVPSDSDDEEDKSLAGRAFERADGDTKNFVAVAPLDRAPARRYLNWLCQRGSEFEPRLFSVDGRVDLVKILLSKLEGCKTESGKPVFDQTAMNTIFKSLKDTYLVSLCPRAIAHEEYKGIEVAFTHIGFVTFGPSEWVDGIQADPLVRWGQQEGVTIKHAYSFAKNSAYSRTILGLVRRAAHCFVSYAEECILSELDRFSYHLQGVPHECDDEYQCSDDEDEDDDKSPEDAVKHGIDHWAYTSRDCGTSQVIWTRRQFDRLHAKGLELPSDVITLVMSYISTCCYIFPPKPAAETATLTEYEDDEEAEAARLEKERLQKRLQKRQQKRQKKSHPVTASSVPAVAWASPISDFVTIPTRDDIDADVP